MQASREQEIKALQAKSEQAQAKLEQAQAKSEQAQQQLDAMRHENTSLKTRYKFFCVALVNVHIHTRMCGKLVLTPMFELYV